MLQYFSLVSCSCFITCYEWCYLGFQVQIKDSFGKWYAQDIAYSYWSLSRLVLAINGNQPKSANLSIPLDHLQQFQVQCDVFWQMEILCIVLLPYRLERAKVLKLALRWPTALLLICWFYCCIKLKTINHVESTVKSSVAWRDFTVLHDKYESFVLNFMKCRGQVQLGS